MRSLRSLSLIHQLIRPPVLSESQAAAFFRMMRHRVVTASNRSRHYQIWNQKRG